MPQTINVHILFLLGTLITIGTSWLFTHYSLSFDIANDLPADIYSNDCDAGELTVNLIDLHNGTIPNGSVLVWSLDDDPADGLIDIIDNPIAIGVSDNYYAYYMDDGGTDNDTSDDCYSPGSCATVQIIDCSCIAGIAPPALSMGGSPPANILLIIADDMGVEVTPGYNTGANKPVMPNINQLVATGLTFDNAWAYPVCSPTRSAILTGKYGYRTNVLNAVDFNDVDPGETTIQSYINNNASETYANAIFGKWHLSDNASQTATMGIGEFKGFMGGGETDYYSWTLHDQNDNTTTVNSYITGEITDLATDWVTAQIDPWFCWVAYSTPHDPFHVPPAGTHSQVNPTTDREMFFAMMENLDYEIGRLISGIPNEDLANTLIIFVGDNGTDNAVIDFPYESGTGKGRLYQGGVHVPLVVNGSGVSRKGERDQNLIQVTDIFSTVAEASGIAVPTYEDSESFLPLLNNSSLNIREFNYSEVTRNAAASSGYTVRNDEYKMIVFDNGNVELYNLINDPIEQINLNDGSLTAAEATALSELQAEANRIRS